MSFNYILREKAKKLEKVIIYPEGEDERVILAVSYLLREKILKDTILVGNKDKIFEKIKNLELKNLDNVKILDPFGIENYDKIQEFSNILYEKRKHKGMTKENAENLVKNNLYFSCFYVKTGFADGFVGGVINTTGDTVRAALFSIGLKKDIKYLSSFFILEIPNCTYGNNGIFFFADCAVIPMPNVDQLVYITKNTYLSYKSIFKEEPKIALLSYSTKGSANSESILNIKKACEILHEKFPEINVDGEIQLDAAIIDKVAKLKCPESNIGGKANILIFPDLNAGNIGYKLVERFAKAKAIGPILSGLDLPGNDLSRGCSKEDIIDVSAITALQSEM